MVWILWIIPSSGNGCRASGSRSRLSRLQGALASARAFGGRLSGQQLELHLQVAALLAGAVEPPYREKIGGSFGDGKGETSTLRPKTRSRNDLSLVMPFSTIGQNTRYCSIYF